ncbi:molybdopterin cofactor-binding domain-containing protein, partial [Pandoraea pneumonica]
ELDVEAAQVAMELGHTDATPNQGPTIASATLQISAIPLRCAAAQARHALIELASRRFDIPAERLTCDGGCVFGETVDGT